MVKCVIFRPALDWFISVSFVIVLLVIMSAPALFSMFMRMPVLMPMMVFPGVILLMFMMMAAFPIPLLFMVMTVSACLFMFTRIVDMSAAADLPMSMCMYMSLSMCLMIMAVSTATFTLFLIYFFVYCLLCHNLSSMLIHMNNCSYVHIITKLFFCQ